MSFANIAPGFFNNLAMNHRTNTLIVERIEIKIDGETTLGTQSKTRKSSFRDTKPHKF